jgi:HAD superfamily hydrolase (TIGR01549 family)
MSYKHIIFDIDGTLLDTEKTGIMSLKKTVFDVLGKEMSLDELYPYFGITSSEAVVKLGFEDKLVVEKIWEENFQSLSYLIQPFVGVDKMLERIKNEGLILGIITSRTREELISDLNIKRWFSLFDYIICAEDSKKHKPNPDPMFEYLSKSGAKAEECLYIGDTIYDYNCSNGAGVDFVLIDWSYRNKTDIAAKYIVNNSDDILNILGLK